METAIKIATGIVIAVAVIVVLMVVDTLLDLLKAITAYFKTKANPKPNLTIRMENTINLMLVINKIIEMNLMDKKAIQLTLRVPFNVLKADEDVKELSSFVHDALIQEIFTSESDIIVLSGYIEQYIVSQSMAALMECYKETNQIIAQMGVIMGDR